MTSIAPRRSATAAMTTMADTAAERLANMVFDLVSRSRALTMAIEASANSRSSHAMGGGNAALLTIRRAARV